MMIKRAYRYRFYPNKKQRLQLAQTFGCTRFVYNWALRLLTDAYYRTSQKMSYKETSNQLTQLKQDTEYCWLKDVTAVPLQQALRHLNTAFLNFFGGRAKYPKFKKKRNKQSATYASNAFKWDGEKLTLAKMEFPLKIKWHRHFTGVPTTVTVSKDSASRYFVSFSVEEEIEQLIPIKEQVAIDLGIKDVIVSSKGFSSGNPKYYSYYQKKLAKLQKRLAKKQKGSKNRDKARLKVAKLHAKIADCRKDFLNKLTISLIRENQVVITESLAVKNMIKNHPPYVPPIRGDAFGRGVADAAWGELIRQLDYKANWYGRILVQVDRFFPSSKRCHACGQVLEKLPLEIREWDCVCGSHNLRDYNAALNLLAVGRTVLAYGDTSVGDTAIALSSQVSSK
ncbi:MAG: RNA-guided endonuclease TnpB family protein [Xenococcaceae cyanobacterium MO_207.B15]|nr:RNA-guided endonuclease TnpB family protein [Xenococcaceae cyanobacterium MO_207.B15]